MKTKTAAALSFITLSFVLSLSALAYASSSTNTLQLQATLPASANVVVNGGNAVVINSSANGSVLGLPGSQIQQTSQVGMNCTSGTTLSLSLSSEKSFKLISADGSVSIPYTVWTTAGNTSLNELNSSGSQVNLSCDGSPLDFQLNLSTGTLSRGLAIGVYTDVVSVNMAY